MVVGIAIEQGGKARLRVFVMSLGSKEEFLETKLEIIPFRGMIPRHQV